MHDTYMQYARTRANARAQPIQAVAGREQAGEQGSLVPLQHSSTPALQHSGTCSSTCSSARARARRGRGSRRATQRRRAPAAQQSSEQEQRAASTAEPGVTGPTTYCVLRADVDYNLLTAAPAHRHVHCRASGSAPGAASGAAPGPAPQRPRAARSRQHAVHGRPPPAGRRRREGRRARGPRDWEIGGARSDARSRAQCMRRGTAGRHWFREGEGVASAAPRRATHGWICTCIMTMTLEMTIANSLEQVPHCESPSPAPPAPWPSPRAKGHYTRVVRRGAGGARPGDRRPGMSGSGASKSSCVVREQRPMHASNATAPNCRAQQAHSRRTAHPACVRWTYLRIRPAYSGTARACAERPASAGRRRAAVPHRHVTGAPPSRLR